MDLASILATLGIKPNPTMMPNQNWQGLPTAAPINSAVANAIPAPVGGQQPMDLAQIVAPGNRPLPFGTEQGNTITGLPAAPAPNMPLQQIPLANDKQWPPQNTPESDQMKQAMLMIQAALDPDTIAAKADAAGIPPPDVNQIRSGRAAGLGMPPAAVPAPAPMQTSGTIFEPDGFGSFNIPYNTLQPPQVPGPPSPEVGPELAGSLISKPAAVTAEAAAASQPVMPPVTPQDPQVAGMLQAALGGVGPSAATPAQSVAAGLKKALTGVKQPDGAEKGRAPGSSGVISPKDFDSVAAFLAQVMSGQAAPQPAKLPFL